MTVKPLQFGMVGGGNGAMIGNFHRHGALMDDLAVLVAGVFTRNQEENFNTANEWRLPDLSRVYRSYQEMAERESAREDGIDFVSICTPNSTHYAIAKIFLEHGIHVMCDKPLAIEVEQGEELEAIAREKDRLFGITYTYAGYAMPHQARAMVRNGEIGTIINVVGEYPQEWVALEKWTGRSARKSTWRFDPERSGKSNVTADIGSHTEHMMRFMSGLKFEKVLAKFDNIPGDMQLETNTAILARMTGDVPGMLWASQVAFGYESCLKVRVFGDRGAIEWRHIEPDVLKVTKIDQPPQIYTPKRSYLYENVRDMARLAAGNHEGTYEAFGNLYKGFCKHLIAKRDGGDPGMLDYPTVYDGVQGLRFVEACYESNCQGNVWVNV